MLKNKIIALLSVATMMFSLATVASAEKTSIITDPTFAVKYNKDNGDGTHSYYFGISYTFEGTDPITFTSEVMNPDEVEDGEDEILGYKGLGFNCLDIILENTPGVTDKITKVSGTKGITFTQDNLDISCTVTDPSAYFTLKDRGENLYTKFTVTTSEYIDPTAFKCKTLVIGLVDLGTTASESPIAKESWKYSSDPAAITAGAADFLAYTGASSDVNAIDDLDGTVEGIQEIKDKFAGKYYVVGEVEVDGATPVENLYLYAYLADNTADKHYAPDSIGTLLNASGAGVVGTIVPVLVVADEAAAELDYQFGMGTLN